MSKPHEIILDASPEQAPVATAIADFLDLSRQSKEIEKRASIAKDKIREFADTRWVSLYASSGMLPPAPFRLVTADGKAVNYVVQDKTSGYQLKPEVDEELRALFGEKKAAELIRTDLAVEFDEEVMRERTASGVLVHYVVGAELAKFRSHLESTGLSADQARRLVQLRHVRVLNPGLLGRLPALAGKATHSVAEVLSILSSSVVRFIRA